MLSIKRQRLNEKGDFAHIYNRYHNTTKPLSCDTKKSNTGNLITCTNELINIYTKDKNNTDTTNIR